MKIDLSHRHPEYTKYLRRWEMAFDFWRGGVHVLAPDHDIAQVKFFRITDSDPTSGEAPQLKRQESDYEWYSTSSRSYIWKHEVETLTNYQERCARQVNVPPIFQYIVNMFASGILRQQVKYDYAPGDAFWVDFHDNCDLRGTTFEAFRRKVLALGLVFGRIHTIVDRPTFSGVSMSREEQIYRGERSYIRIITPFDLVDWSVDTNGFYRWVVLREPAPDLRAPGEEFDGQQFQYRVLFPGYWEVWLEHKDPLSDGGHYELIQSGESDLGYVPIQGFFATREGMAASMGCETPLPDFLDLNRYVLNRFSELDESERMESFAQLAFPEADSPIGPIEISHHRALVYDAAAGAPSYISPDPALANGKYSRIANLLELAKQFSPGTRGRAEFSKTERSADAILAESEDKRNQMAWWAEALAEWEDSVNYTIMDFEDIDNAPKVEYPKRFDMRVVSRQIDEALKLSSIGVVPPEVVAEIVKPIVSRILTDSGIPQEEVAATVKKVKKYEEEEPKFAEGQEAKEEKKEKEEEGE